MMWGPWGWGMGFGSVLFLALIFVGIFLIVRAPSGEEPRRDRGAASTILDERFARGEIDEEEYRRRLRTLVESG